MPTFNKFVEFLKTVNVFSKFYADRLSEEKMQELCKHCQYLVYPEGSEISVVSNDRYFYLMEKGKVALEKNGKKVADVEQGVFGGRNIFGLEQGADKVKAEMETAVYRVPEPLLKDLLLEISQELKVAALEILI